MTEFKNKGPEHWHEPSLLELKIVMVTEDTWYVGRRGVKPPAGGVIIESGC